MEEKKIPKVHVISVELEPDKVMQLFRRFMSTVFATEKCLAEADDEEDRQYLSYILSYFYSLLNESDCMKIYESIKKGIDFNG